MQERKIIHLDMDCFYAAIEIRERPELAQRAVAVGGSRDRRGVLTTCNYEARKFGVRSAMPTFLALQRCPDLVVLPVRFEFYRQESGRIREILSRWTSLIEPLSLDEAYLDVSHREESGAAIAADIRRTIFAETGLTASAGIAPNKFLAKVASDWNKPNGQFEITASDIPQFMEHLPVRKVWGVGAVSAERMGRMGIRTCGDLQKLTRVELHRLFGKWGLELFDLCRGIDSRPVVADRERKSLSTERTFLHNLGTLAECESKLEELYADLMADLARAEKDHERRVRKLFLKLKFADFTRTTAERIGAEPRLKDYQELLAEAFQRRDQTIRLMGIGVRFEPAQEEDAQLVLPI
ncbi:MAG: DNA polymerase IV [Verrucomicrobiota bacterium]